MLARWRQKIKAASPSVKKISDHPKPAIRAASGAIAAAQSAANDETRNMVATASQVTPDNSASGQVPTNKTPKKVASPLPPLKPSQTGKQCPTNAAPPATRPSSVQYGLSPAIARVIKAGATLLRPIQDEFYGDRSARLEDPFGHRWNIGHSIEQVATDEMQRRYTKLLSDG